VINGLWMMCRRQRRKALASFGACWQRPTPPVRTFLQTLGALINIDLPWNPSNLEQRIVRIERVGQARNVVDLL